MNANFKVIGLTRLGIELKSTALEVAPDHTECHEKMLVFFSVIKQVY